MRRQSNISKNISNLKALTLSIKNQIKNHLQKANFKAKGLKRDLAIMLLLFAAGSLGLFAAAQPAAESGMIRLHIFADSDSFYDQTVKSIVKDGVMDYVGCLTAECKSAAETAAVLKSHLAEINAVADGIAQNYGSAAQTSYGVFAYGERLWQGKTMPAGNYESLKIVLGSGRGHNWFCVLYPDLCPTGRLENAEDLQKTRQICRNKSQSRNYNPNPSKKSQNNNAGENSRVQIRLGSFFLNLTDK